jgi:hypothetical protein
MLLTMGLAYIGLMFAGYLFVYRVYSTTEETVKPGNDDEAIVAAKSRKVGRILVQPGKVSFIATVCSSFVLQSALYYGRDLKESAVDTPAGYTYLFFVGLAVLSSLLAGCFGSLLSASTNFLNSVDQRLVFLSNTKPIRYCVYLLFVLTVFGWFGAACLFGNVIYHPDNYIIYGVVGVGAILAIGGPLYKFKCTYILKDMEHVLAQRGGVEMLTKPETDSSEARELHLSDIAQYERVFGSRNISLATRALTRCEHWCAATTPDVMNILSGSCTFFGAFSYSALQNLSYEDNYKVQAYIFFMACSFVFGFVTVIWSNVYSIFYFSFQTSRTQVMYQLSSKAYYWLTMFMAAVSLVSFFIGFALLTYCRPFSSDKYLLHAQVAAVGIMIMFSLLVALMAYIHKFYVEGQNFGRNWSPDQPKRHYLMDETYVTTFTQETAASSLTSSFVAGSIVFEFLYKFPTGTNVENAAYYLMITIVFTCAAGGAVLTAWVYFLLNQLHTMSKRQFCYLLHINSIPTVFYIVNFTALFVWALSLTIYGKVTYDLPGLGSDNMLPSQIFGTVCTVVVAASVYHSHFIWSTVVRESVSKSISDGSVNKAMSVDNNSVVEVCFFTGKGTDSCTCIVCGFSRLMSGNSQAAAAHAAHSSPAEPTMNPVRTAVDPEQPPASSM